MEDFYNIIKENGIDKAAIDIGCILGLSIVRDNPLDYIEKTNKAFEEIEKYFKDYNISNDIKKTFLVKVYEYSNIH